MARKQRKNPLSNERVLAMGFICSASPAAERRQATTCTRIRRIESVNHNAFILWLPRPLMTCVALRRSQSSAEGFLIRGEFLLVRASNLQLPLALSARRTSSSWSFIRGLQGGFGETPREEREISPVRRSEFARTKVSSELARVAECCPNACKGEHTDKLCLLFSFACS